MASSDWRADGHGFGRALTRLAWAPGADPSEKCGTAASLCVVVARTSRAAVQPNRDPPAPGG